MKDSFAHRATAMDLKWNDNVKFDLPNLRKEVQVLRGHNENTWNKLYQIE